jgi:hypothetical protein
MGPIHKQGFRMRGPDLEMLGQNNSLFVGTREKAMDEHK